MRPASLRGIVFGSSLACSLSLSVASIHAQKVEYSTQRRERTQTVSQTIQGAPKVKARLAAGRTAVSVGVGHFLGEGTTDLVTGYATSTGGALVLQRGQRAATAPTETEFATLAAGGKVPAFHSSATATELPIRPDLLTALDINGDGAADVLVAQRGDTALHYLLGDGNGGFQPGQIIPLAGAVSALTTWRAPGGELLFVAAVKSSAATGLQFFNQLGEQKGFVTLPSAATRIEAASLNHGHCQDLAVVSGGSVLVLDGDSLLGSAPHIDSLHVSGATALASGSFVYDYRGLPQLAVLTSSGTLEIFTREGLDTHESTREERLALRAASQDKNHVRRELASLTGTAWAHAETVAGVGSGSEQALLLSAHLNPGYDTLQVFSGTQSAEVTHTAALEGTQRKSIATVTLDSLDRPVLAAVAARVTPDSRLGVLAADGSRTASVTSPTSTYRTINVNTTADAVVTTTAMTSCKSNTAGCSLRAAIAVANTDQNAGATSFNKVDTINVPPGNYTLTSTNSGTASRDANGDIDYHFNVDSNVNFVGGAACTLTGAQATACPVVLNGNGLDQLFNINSFLPSANSGNGLTLSVYMTNLQIQNGRNTDDLTYGNGAYPYIENFGGAMGFDSLGNGQLVLNQVNLTSNTMANGNGGAIGQVNSNPGGVGLLEIDNSTLRSNQASEDGGAVYLNLNERFTLSNSTVTSNSTYVNNADSASKAGAGQGGGIYDLSETNTASATISNSAITANTSNSDSGGMYLADGGNIINTSFSNNSATGTLNSTSSGGAGLRVANGTGSLAILYSTFVGNTLTNSSAYGAGLQISPGSAGANLQYNRFHGNTGGLAGTQGLAVGTPGGSGIASTINATNNWWSCNVDPQSAGTNCDAAHAYQGQLTTAPYTTLTLGLSATTVAAGNNITATASLGQNSGGTLYSATQVSAYLATPITSFTLSNASSVTYSPSATTFATGVASSNAAAVATGSTSTTGTGTAKVVVDGLTVTSTYTVTAPDLSVTSAHSGNFKAGDTADVYTLTVGNIGNASTSGTVTVVDTLPSGFTATALSGTGWTCTLASLTCTRSDALSASVAYPALTLTTSVSATLAGSYTNTVRVSGGGEVNTGNSTSSDTTIVVGQPTLSETFSPSPVAPSVTSTVTFTVSNPSANAVSLTGVSFSDILPAGLQITAGATTNCSGATVTGTNGGTTATLTGATIAAGTSCTVSFGVASPTLGTYTNTTGSITATNANAGAAATAQLVVSVTPTKAVFTTAPAAIVTAGGSAGTVAVTLEDAAGNIAANSSATVTLTVAGPGTYSQVYTAATTNGTATFNLSSVALTAAGTYTYTASATGLSTAQSTETVNPGTFSALSLSGYPSSTTAQLPGAVTVRATDTYGNAVTNFTGTVTVSASDATASISPVSYTYTASDAGSHAFAVTFNTAGTYSLQASSGTVTGSQTGILVGDAVWVLAATGQRTEITEAGSAIVSGIGTSASVSSYGALAIDASGNVWSVAAASNALAYNTYSGASATVYTGGGLAAPVAVAIDGLGYIWIANSGTSSVSEFAYTPSSGAVGVSPRSGYATGAGSTGIAIDISGSVWTANGTDNTITRLLGAAAPVVSPTALAVKTNVQGTRP